MILAGKFKPKKLDLNINPIGLSSWTKWSGWLMILVENEKIKTILLESMFELAKSSFRKS